MMIYQKLIGLIVERPIGIQLFSLVERVEGLC